jgi:hypothetical protein
MTYKVIFTLQQRRKSHFRLSNTKERQFLFKLNWLLCKMAPTRLSAKFRPSQRRIVAFLTISGQRSAWFLVRVLPLSATFAASTLLHAPAQGASDPLTSQAKRADDKKRQGSSKLLCYMSALYCSDHIRKLLCRERSCSTSDSEFSKKFS